MITPGTWIVEETKQAAFLDPWSMFAGWASSMDAAGTLRLGRHGRDSNRFVSFGPWDSADQVQVWKPNPEFRERMANVLQHVDELSPTELVVVAGTAGVPTHL
jgi:heme-degrading monooxygenase HmoA